MLYRLITGSRTLTAFIIFLISLITWLPAFLSTENSGLSLSEQQMPLYRLISNALEGKIMMTKVIAFLLVLFIGILLFRIRIQFALVQKRTFLPALFYVILTGYLPGLHYLNEVLIASLFLLLTLKILMDSYQVEPNSYRFFDAGILLGIGALFYAPMIYFLIFIWLSIKILRSFYWREYIYPVLGLLIPFIFYFTWLFLNDIDINVFMELFKDLIFRGFPALLMKWPYKLFTLYSTIVVLISSIYMLKVFQFRKIYIRSFFLIFFWLFVLSILIFILASGFDTGLIYIISIPVTFLLTNYFAAGRDTWWNKLLIYLFILGLLVLVISEEVNWI